MVYNDPRSYDPAAKINVLKHLLRVFLSQVGTSTNDINEELQSLKWQCSSCIHPNAMSDNNSVVISIWENQIWAKPVNVQAYPITKVSLDVVKQVNSLLLKQCNIDVNVVNGMLTSNNEVINNIKNVLECAADEIRALKYKIAQSTAEMFLEASSAISCDNIVQSAPVQIDVAADDVSTTPTSAIEPVKTINKISPKNGEFTLSSSDSSINVLPSTNGLNLKANLLLDEQGLPNTSYYNNNSSSSTEDGSKKHPWKTLEGACRDAVSKSAQEHQRVAAFLSSANSYSLTEVITRSVHAVDGASHSIRETFTIGTATQSPAIRIYLPHLVLNGTISIDCTLFGTNSTNNRFSLVAKTIASTFLLKPINVQTVNATSSSRITVNAASSSRITDPLIFDITAEVKIAKENHQTFICDLSSTNPGDIKLLNSGIIYKETISEIVEEATPANHGTAASNLQFVFDNTLKDSTLTFQCFIKSSFPENMGSTTSTYAAFNSPSINPSVYTEYFLTGIPDSKGIFNFERCKNSSSSFIKGSALIKTTDGIFNSLESKTIFSKNIEATSTFKIPITNATGSEPGQLAIDPVSNTMYYYGGNRKRHYVGSSTSVSSNISYFNRFYASHNAYTMINTSEIRMPSMKIECFNDFGQDAKHTLEIPTHKVNCRQTDVVENSITYSKQANSMNDFDFSKDTYHGLGVLKLTDVTNVVFTDASTTTAVKQSATVTVASGASDIISKGLLIKGCTVCFTNSSDRTTISMCIENVMSSSDRNLVITGFSNIGSGTLLVKNKFPEYVPIDTTSTANAKTWNSLYLGDKMDFDPSKKYLINKKGEFFELHYHPVFFQDELHKDKYATVLIGFNPRLAKGSTAGSRSFNREHISKIYSDFLSQKWNSAQVFYQNMSLYFTGGISNSYENTINNYRALRSCSVQFIGNSYKKTLHVGICGNYKLFNTPISYSQIEAISGENNKYIENTSQPTSLSSMLQDEVSVENIVVSYIPDVTVNHDLSQDPYPYIVQNTSRNDSWFYSLPEKTCLKFDANQLIALGESSSVDERKLFYAVSVYRKTQNLYSTCVVKEGKVIMTRQELDTILKESEQESHPTPIAISKMMVNGTDKDINMI